MLKKCQSGIPNKEIPPLYAICSYLSHTSLAMMRPTATARLIPATAINMKNTLLNSLRSARPFIRIIVHIERKRKADQSKTLRYIGNRFTLMDYRKNKSDDPLLRSTNPLPYLSRCRILSIHENSDFENLPCQFHEQHDTEQ